MKLILDIPNNFVVDTYADHEVIRQIYTRILQIAIGLGLTVEVKKARDTDGFAAGDPGPDCIRYAYHDGNLGPNTYCLKQSALPGRWYFDAAGYSGWAAIAKDPTLQEAGADFDLDRATGLIETYRKRFLGEGWSKIEQPHAPLPDSILNARPFVFYPLQVDNDRVLDHLPWTQSEALEALLAIPRADRKALVVKRHPYCQSRALSALLERAEQAGDILVTEASIHELIPRADAVLVSNSGVGLEALIHGKPVYSMAACEYRHLTHQIKSLDTIGNVFTDPPAPPTERQIRQLGYLIGDYWVDISSNEDIKARLKTHLAAYRATAHAETSSPETAAPSSAQTALLARVKKELGNSVELLLRDMYPDPDATVAERVEVLGRAAGEGIKTDLILRLASPDVHLVAARHLINRGKYDKGREFAIAAQQDETQMGRALSLLALADLKQGEKEAALARLNEAVVYPDIDAQSFVMKSQLLLGLGDAHFPEAFSAAQTALNMDPERTFAYLSLSKIEIARGNLAEGRAYLKEALKREPDHPAIKRFAETLPGLNDS